MTNPLDSFGKSRPRIGITMGDPAGIGPEVVLKAVAEEEVQSICVPVIIGNAQVLTHNARTLDLQCGYEIVRQGERIPAGLDAPNLLLLKRNIKYMFKADERVEEVAS